MEDPKTRIKCVIHRQPNIYIPLLQYLQMLSHQRALIIALRPCFIKEIKKNEVRWWRRVISHYACDKRHIPDHRLVKARILALLSLIVKREISIPSCTQIIKDAYLEPKGYSWIPEQWRDRNNYITPYHTELAIKDFDLVYESLKGSYESIKKDV